jgi:BirA family transcriptional regulator, biotin operon repressor / biotin---[acetyl-CoA-carboxylase] ligase
LHYFVKLLNILFKNFNDTLFLGKRVIYLPKCHSTNDIAAEMIRSNSADDGTIIITDFQSGGRGQRGNTWISQQGSNLLFSIILRPEFLTAGNIFSLNMAVSLGIFDALIPALQALKIKWPNDIFHYDKKLGGILIENNIQGSRVLSSVVGIGLNVNQESFETDKAVSMKQISGVHLDRSDIFRKIILGIDNKYSMLNEFRSEELYNNYIKVLYRLGEKHRFRSREEFSGTIVGIDDLGRLKVMIEGKLRFFGFREIEYMD